MARPLSLRAAPAVLTAQQHCSCADGNGNVLVVETKLARNDEVRRKVIGQVLEYAAYLWKIRGVQHRQSREQGRELSFAEGEEPANTQNTVFSTPEFSIAERRSIPSSSWKNCSRLSED